MSQDCSFSAGASRLDPVDLTNEAFYIPPKYTSTNMSQGRRQSSSIKSPSEQHQRLTDEFHTIGLGTSDVQVRIASANSGETEGTPMRSNFDTEADPQTKLSKQQNFAGLVEENERLLRILAETQSELEASKKEGVKMQKTLSKGLPPRPSNNGDLRQELDEARLLLEERTTELHSAQLYLTKADIHSDVDCAALVESLNIDIMQVTAIIADDASSACPRPFPQTDFKRIQRAEKKISACQLLGADLKVSLMSLARRARSQVDPSVSIQFALQALLVEMSFRIITSWDWLHPNDQQLDALYQKICDAEGSTPVSGRWRSLTRKQSKQLPSDTKELLRKLFTSMVVYVLWASGWSEEHESAPALLQTCLVRCKALLDRIITADRVLYQEVLSSDLRIPPCFPGTVFNVETMDDSEGQKEGILANEPIAFSMGLGLMSADKDSHYLLKSKVFLQSSFRELLQQA